MYPRRSTPASDGKESQRHSCDLRDAKFLAHPVLPVRPATTSALFDLQERPLDTLGAEEAIRGVYEHSLGVAIVVRALRVKGQAILVAKVRERGGGPLGWMTSRRLSAAEWETLDGEAARLPAGRHQYFPQPAASGMARKPDAKQARPRPCAPCSTPRS